MQRHQQLPTPTIIPEDIPEELKPKWGWIKYIPIFLIACGCMYLGGYWEYYHVNFLEYISISEVLARSVFDVVPIVLVILECALGVFIFSHWAGFKKWKWLKKWEEREEAKRIAANKPMPWIVRHAFAKILILPLSFLLIFLVTIIVSSLHGDPLIGFVMGSPFFLAAIIGPILEVRYPKVFKDGLGAALTFLIFFGPTLCWMRGAIEAEGKKFEPEKSNITTLVYTEFDEKVQKQMPEGYVYAGRLGSYIFLASKKYSSTLAIPEKRVTFLDIYKRKTNQQPPP